MAIEMVEETLTGSEAVALFRDIMGDPEIKEGIFYGIAGSGKVRTVGGPKKGWKYYLKEDVIKAAEERKREQEELAGLLVLRQVAGYIAKRGVSVRYRELERMAESGRLPTARRSGKTRYFRTEDVDSLIAQLRDINALKERAKGLMETMEAVNWINARLKALGKVERIEMNNLYKQVERGIIVPDMIIPTGEKNRAIRYCWSMATLEQHPIFLVPEPMPDIDEVKPVRVTSTRVLLSLEERWGDLLNRHGIKEEGLSMHFVDKKNRTITYVGYDGPVQWFPARYIPRKQRRREKPIDLIGED